MELNALTRWASVGQNLYKQDARNDLRILKSRQTAAGASMAGLDRVVEEAEADLDERELASPVLSPITEEQIEDESGDIPLKVSPALVHPIKADILRRKSFEWSWRLFIIRALRRFGKGCLIGYGGRAAFSLLPVIIKARLNPFKVSIILFCCVTRVFFALLVLCLSVLRLFLLFHLVSPLLCLVSVVLFCFFFLVSYYGCWLDLERFSCFGIQAHLVRIVLGHVFVGV